MSRLRSGLALLAILAGASSLTVAQQYRLRLDSQFQSVNFRGVRLDSVLASATVAGSGGGRETTDGFSVRCAIGETYCFYFRPGSVQSAQPAVTSAAATVWGFGVTGLSLRADARIAMDLGSAEVWPGTSPALQLLEGYAEYSYQRFSGRLGRQVYTSRLGFTGFDGARITARLAASRLDLDGYLGWGLGRGSALPVTSAALNPLDDFQPRERQLVAGAAVGWNNPLGTVRLDYQREVDPRSNYFVSERVAGAVHLRLPRNMVLEAGSEYDLAQALWGSADLNLRYALRSLAVTAGYRRYRPHFELWTIWGAFSPVGYSAVNGTIAFSPVRNISVRARASRFWFEEAETETPLVSVEDRGWRVNLGAGFQPTRTLFLNLDHDIEFGPGGSYTSVLGTVSFLPTASISLSLNAGRLNRPLEFRFDEATLHLIGLDAGWQISERWRASVSASHLVEDRDRPDAAAFDWNQTRLAARVSVFLGHEADHLPLPRAIRRTTRTAAP
jgi:hypothetical protein